MGNTQSFIVDDSQTDKFIPVLDFEKVPILLPSDKPKRQFSQRSIESSKHGLIPWPEKEEFNDAAFIDRRLNYSPPQLLSEPDEPIPELLTRSDRSNTVSSTDSSICRSLPGSPTGSLRKEETYAHSQITNGIGIHDCLKENYGNTPFTDIPPLQPGNRNRTSRNYRLSEWSPDLRLQSHSNSKSSSNTHSRKNPCPCSHLEPQPRTPQLSRQLPDLQPQEQPKPFRNSSDSVSDSIKSQLSILSQHNPTPGSPRRYNRSNKANVNHVDAGLPPPVPEHTVFPVSKQPDFDFASAIDAETMPERRRSKSFSSVSIPKRRVSSCSTRTTASQNANPTDIYTRKCSSPVRDVSKKDVSKRDEDVSDVDLKLRSFILDGYNEGVTKLKVVNGDSESDNDDDNDNDNNSLNDYDISYESLYSNCAPDDKCKKYFVKSKAQLAEEEEMKRNNRFETSLQ